MKTWHNVTKDELVQELCPGVTMTNGELINRLNWAEYLNIIKSIIELGINDNEDVVDGYIEGVLRDLYDLIIRIMEDRYPDKEESDAYISSSSTQDTKRSLIKIAMAHTSKSWPDFEKEIKQKLNIE